MILRNQNRAPVPAFSYTLLNPGHLLDPAQRLGLEDPESKPLAYEWWIDGIEQTETGVVVQKTVTRGAHSVPSSRCMTARAWSAPHQWRPTHAEATTAGEQGNALIPAP